MKVRAVIFDLNGTLVDDIRFHFEAWTRLAEKIGAVMSQSIFQSFNGLKNEDIFPRLLGREVGPALIDALGREKEEHYRELYRPHLAPVAGANGLLARLRSEGVKLGLASSAPPANRAMVLDGLSWNDTFDAVIVPEGIPGKPAPDIFLEAAKALDVPPSACVVFEDAWNGVKAASTAGMTVIGITTNVDAEVLFRGGAVATFADFTNLPDLDTFLR
ncbi:MAG TPA: HAD family phosphatase [Labilithrix sp.]|jgi:HAD superfamily hydrolase (TIGR01509 family)|nr:HAD family phosphatase [Labilithrix sp.]